MSTQTNDSSGDWRRQRRRGRGSATLAPEPASPEDEPEEVPSVETGRTLFSFLEPALDVIATFSAPLVVAGVIGLITGILLASFVSSMREYGYICIAFGGGLLLLVGLVSLSSVFAAFISRTGRYGVNSLVMLAAFLGIIVVANFISFANHSRVDVTATNQFSLANSTRNLLNDLDTPIHATAFYPGEYGRDQNMLTRRIKVAQTLEEFAARSTKFTYDFVDPDLKPEIAREKGLTQYESVIVEGQDTGILDAVLVSDELYSQLEQDLYTSILVASGRDQKKVYFLAGHGERSINTTISEGYATIRNELQTYNYAVENLSWSAAETEVTVPADAALLVVAGPRGELPEAHANTLNQFLQGRNPDGTERTEGGRMIFLVEPDVDDTWREFLLTWGVAVSTRYILDLDGSVSGEPHTLQLSSYFRVAPRDIIAPRGRPLSEVFMPGAAALSGVDDGWRQPRPLVGSTLNSYLVKDTTINEPVTEGDNPDPKSFYVPALLLDQVLRPVSESPPAEGTPPPPQNRISGIVVFGDADFLSNSLVNRGSGAALFLNSANYLLGDVSLASIRDRAFVFRELNLDRNEFNLVRFTSWLFLPGLMGLLAGLVWWIRR